VLQLLLLLTLLLPSTPPANDAGVFPYIPTPHASAAPLQPGETLTIAIDVYGTLDEATLVTVTVDIDPRLVVDGYAAAGTAVDAGRARCSGAGPVVCEVPVRRWQPAGIVVSALLPGGAWPCTPLVITATAEAGDLIGTVMREQPIAGAGTCTTVALPAIGGP
jgi:hypothetical protein